MVQKSLLVGLVILLGIVSPAQAIVNPLATPNNIHGIHIIDENGLDDAAALVNSTGGDWGYATLVLTDTDRNRQKWQATFDRMRQLHLIPIIRIATHVEGDVWRVPDERDINNWIDFLDSLNWVVKNRYVVLFNEPNHAKEWGGSVKPGEYARILKEFSQKLKAASDDFFVLPAGLDASAPNGELTMDEVMFLQKMTVEVPDVFAHIDGWTSHAYPNPGFSGSPQDVGRGTVRTFAWERSLWPSLGIVDNLPIFITETGWMHRGDEVSTQQAAQNLVAAFQAAWQDSNIVAVTPFLLNYQTQPFDEFSYRKPNSEEFFAQFTATQNIAKQSGDPIQIHDALFVRSDIPPQLVSASEYRLSATFENTGQSIWEADEGFTLSITAPDELGIQTARLHQTAPTQQTTTEITLTTPAVTGSYEIVLQMTKDGKPFGDAIVKTIEVVPPPSILLRVQLWFMRRTRGDDFTFLVYREGQLQKKVENVPVINGKGTIDQLRDVVPGREYRFVLLKPFYLPQQVFARLDPHTTTLIFPRFLPVDFNNDGAFTRADARAFLQNPAAAVARLWPF